MSYTGCLFHHHKLHELHRLPVRQRINFKVECLVFSIYVWPRPDYLINNCHLVTGSLRSAIREYIVFYERTIVSMTSFSSSIPHLSNSLPNDLQQEETSYEHFNQQVNIYLFRGTAQCDLLIICTSKYFYKLTSQLRSAAEVSRHHA